jgi:hypothetical protein
LGNSRDILREEEEESKAVRSVPSSWRPEWNVSIADPNIRSIPKSVKYSRKIKK